MPLPVFADHGTFLGRWSLGLIAGSVALMVLFIEMPSLTRNDVILGSSQVGIAAIDNGAQVSNNKLPSFWRNNMAEMTAGDMVRGIFTNSVSAGGAGLARRMDALTTLVLDLLAEVEALREALASGHDYRDTYRETCLLTHNSAGVLTGWEKLIQRYYPGQQFTGGRVWRESVMMRRLGFTPAEIEAYQREAEEAETYT